MKESKAMMFKSAILSLLLIGGVAGGAMAQARGTQSDQDACEPDVHRLCDQYIPDETQIVACLTKEKRHLSPACARVMSR